MPTLRRDVDRLQSLSAKKVSQQRIPQRNGV